MPNRFLKLGLVALTAAPLFACGGEFSTIAGEEFVDDVVQSGEGDDTGTVEAGLGGRPTMRIPFKCGQRWLSQTRAGHSPEVAIDWNRDGDFGDDVVASADGVVTRSESEGNVSYGNWVEVQHANNYRTRYAHLSVRSVRVGQRVQMGQKVGEVGSTGGSTGPHLHYEQLLGSSPIRIILGSTPVRYFETRWYTSKNSCP